MSSVQSVSSKLVGKLGHNLISEISAMCPHSIDRRIINVLIKFDPDPQRSHSKWLFCQICSDVLEKKIQIHFNKLLTL